MKRKDVFEAKIEENEKAGSHRESNPGHLACAASTVPLSYDNQTTTSPHYFVYSLLVHVHIQVSYSSACLSDALQQLPEHFCMLPSKEYLIAGIAGLITYFQWKKVLVISQEYSTFAFVSAALS